MNLKEEFTSIYQKKSSFKVKFSKKLENTLISSKIALISNVLEEKRSRQLKFFRRYKPNHLSNRCSCSRHHVKIGNSSKWICCPSTFLALNNMLSKKKYEQQERRMIYKFPFI